MRRVRVMIVDVYMTAVCFDTSLKSYKLKTAKARMLKFITRSKISAYHFMYTLIPILPFRNMSPPTKKMVIKGGSFGLADSVTAAVTYKTTLILRSKPVQ